MAGRTIHRCEAPPPVSGGRVAEVLVLTAHTGAGHRSVARVVAEETRTLACACVSPHVADVFALASGPSPIETIVQKGYGAAIVHAPVVWGAVYHATRPRPVYGALTAALGQAALRRVELLLAAHQPRLVVATHPLALWLAGAAVRRLQAGSGTRPPLWAMVTDLVSLHPAWVGTGKTVERYLVGCPEGAHALRRLGVREGAITVTGLPVDRRFAALSANSRPREGLASVLVVGGGEGAGGIVAVARRIAAAHPWLRLTVVCGRNQRAYAQLREVLGGRPEIAIHGYVDDMPALMAEADVVVTKGGSVTIAEAVAAGRPPLLMEMLPGQEAGNAALVAQRGAGIGARGPRRVVRALGELAACPERLAGLVSGCRLLSYPDAATAVGHALVARCREDAG
ncbi:MAG: glycosyltransferase [Chloroflexota bacterium]